MSLPETFWSKTATTDCIIWTGAINSRGYGCFAVDRVAKLAHRLAWEEVNGSIPEGMTIDHICRVRSCVNVAHMEVVSRRENTARRFDANGAVVIGGTCLQGHAIASEADIYRRPTGGRECQSCRRVATGKARERRATQGSPTAIREWANSVGIEVATFGRISRHVRDAYRAAHGERVAS